MDERACLLQAAFLRDLALAVCARWKVESKARGGWRHCWLVATLLLLLLLFMDPAQAWTGRINGGIFCDVCSDSVIGPEDHALEGAEVAVLCITKSGEVVNYQAFTDRRGAFVVTESMPEGQRWDSCLVRPIGGAHPTCRRPTGRRAGIRFRYTRPSGYSHTVRPFLFKPASAPAYCA
ncbi:pollen Ole e 1 allergen and extensin family protein [Wolffia australiana]